MLLMARIEISPDTLVKDAIVFLYRKHGAWDRIDLPALLGAFPLSTHTVQLNELTLCIALCSSKSISEDFSRSLSLLAHIKGDVHLKLVAISLHNRNV